VVKEMSNKRPLSSLCPSSSASGSADGGVVDYESDENDDMGQKNDKGSMRTDGGYDGGVDGERQPLKWCRTNTNNTIGNGVQTHNNNSNHSIGSNGSTNGRLSDNGGGTDDRHGSRSNSSEVMEEDVATSLSANNELGTEL
jgi:hypothetical protein